MSFFASSSVEYERLTNEGSSSAEDETIYTRRHPTTHAPPPHNDRKKRNKNRGSHLSRRKHSPSPGGVQLLRERKKSSVCTRCSSSCTSYTCYTCCFRSNDFCGSAKCLPTTSGVIFFLLLVAFPVHFVDLVITGVSSASSSSSSSVDQCFLVFVCFYSAAILTAILSPFSVSLIGFKWTVVCACSGVMIFTVAKCLPVYFDLLVPLASAVNGLTFGAALAAFRSRSMVATETVSKATVHTETTAVSKATVNTETMALSKETVAVETASELASRCGPILRSCASVYVCLNGGSSAVSAIFWLALFVPRISHRQMSSSPATLDFTGSSKNVTSPTVTWQEAIEATCGSGFRPSLGNELRPEADGYHDDAEALLYRRQALIGCFLLCSLGALLLSMAVLESRRSRPLEAEERSMTFFGRLCRRAGDRLSKVLGQMVDRNRCLVLLESVFLGSQQLFMYFLYLQAFPGCYLGQVDSILVGFTMASVGLVTSYVVAIVLWRFIGRVKLLLTSFALMTSLIVVILYCGSMSRAWAIYCVACLWSVCDCCLHIGITGFIGVKLVDDQPNSPDHSVDPVMSIFTSGHLCGQLIIFLIAGHSLTIAAYTLLGLSAAAACCHLAIEISIRLAETETRERLGKKITIQMNEAHEVTWLPLSNPMQRVLENDVILKFDDSGDSLAE